MKSLKTRYAIIGALVVIVTLLFLIYYNIRGNDNTSKVELDKKWCDGLYFIRWDAYHGYSPEEEPYVQLSLIQVHINNISKEIPVFRRCAVLSNIGEIPATFIFNKNAGPQEKDYSLYTLGLTLPKREQGKYILNKVKLIDENNNEQVHDIGNWIIDIRNNISENDIELGKKTCISSEFDWYRAELRNITKSGIEIENMDFQLSNDIKTNIDTSSDFNMISNLNKNLTIKPDETKTFQFSFEMQNVDGSSLKFISIRPFLLYSINGQKRLTILSTAIYSPQIKDADIKELVKLAR